MKPKEIRELSADEIRRRIEEEERNLDELTFRHAIANLEDPLVLRRKRREVARLKTVLAQQAAA